MNLKKMLPWIIAVVAIYLSWDKIKGMIGMDKPVEAPVVVDTTEIVDNTLA